ncbi:lysozyme inhibitor LprI family protein [Pantoea sp. USHLN298]|uniref:lysozyme inhibitor LprI family protein n=1 Tax=Pantoea sp. USHLN298 TaxID=3081294 RepID=UPI00301B5337
MKTGWLLALLLASGEAMAQDLPADAALNRCLEGATTTQAMNQCYATASKAWDQEMNNQYGKLMNQLTGDSKTELRQAQRAWLSYRDSWLAASRSRLSDQGTLGSVALGAQNLSLVRNQALMLQSLSQGSCANPDDC